MELSSKTRKAIFVAAVVVIVILATLLTLYTYPSRSVERTGILWFGGSGSWSGSGLANGTVQSQNYLFCPPSDAIGNATLGYVWISTRNVSDSSLVVGLLGYGDRVPQVPLYQGNGLARGGFALSYGFGSLLCRGFAFAGFYEAQPYSVSWTFTITYNYTATVPHF
jgi:hypothetical protein